MRKFTVIAAFAMSISAGAANAVVLTQYTQIGAANTFRLTNSGSNFTVGTIGSPLVTITLNDPFSNASITATGMFTFTGTGSAIASVAGTTVTQTIASGSFALTTLAPITFGSFTGTNILSASFTNGLITAVLGTRTPQISVNTPFSTVTSWSSDFNTSANLSLTDFSITTSGATPLIALIAAGGGNQKLRGFQSSEAGTFDVAIVPEPANWAMLITGLGLIGVSMRRRKSEAVAA